MKKNILLLLLLSIGNFLYAQKIDIKEYKTRADSVIKNNEYEKAINLYTELLSVDSVNYLGFEYRARVYEIMEKYQEAKVDYTNALKYNPKSIILYHSRGNIYKLLNEYDSALSDYNKYVALTDENKFIALSRRGSFYMYFYKYDLALADMNKVVELTPKSTYGYLLLANLYINTKQKDLAILALNKALAIDPNDGGIYKTLGVIQKDNGQYNLAIQNFEKNIELAPTRFASYTDILSPLIRIGNFEKAAEYAKKALTLQYTFIKELNFYKHYINVVAFFITTNENEQALLSLNKSLLEYNNIRINKLANFYTKYTDVLNLKGIVLERQKKLNEAKLIYEQSLAINSSQPDLIQAINKINYTLSTIAIEDKIAPEIQLISPQVNRGLQIVSENTIIELVGKAKDPSGISTVSINGKPVTKIEEDGLFISSLTLKPGVNNIVINAADKKGNSISKTFTVMGNAVAKKQETDIIIPVSNTESAPQFHALLIAANDYVDPKIADLENPVKDATELKNILQANYTFSPKNIETLYNKSREEIMEALVVKSNAMGENDNLLIFYAGHGIAEKDKFGDVDGYWVPSSAKKGLNASYISADDINKALKRSSAKHILVVADACFSGAFTRSLSSDASIGVQKQYSVPSRKIMASGNLEPVPDNSKFVYYLKKNLKENKEKYLTAKKLFDSFYEAILNNSETSPQYAAIKNVGDEGGEFVFIKK
jgi:tetratricopeptide (TPR) repeat protein